MSALVIRRVSTGEEVQRIDTTGKTPREIVKVEEGLARNFDFERFYWTEETA